MIFATATATLSLKPELQISPSTTRAHLLSSHTEWKEWTVIDNVAMSYRTILSLPTNHKHKKTVLIVNVGTGDAPVAFWSLGAWDLIEGPQSGPEGKYTKGVRRWFEDVFNVTLPASGAWGFVDASYDPWNQTSMIVCSYRNRFNTETDWHQFKRLNKF